jgi:hypothetical protein
MAAMKKHFYANAEIILKLALRKREAEGDPCTDEAT